MRILETPPQEVTAAIERMLSLSTNELRFTRLDAFSKLGTLLLRWSSMLNANNATILQTSKETRYLETVSLVLRVRKERLTGIENNVLLCHDTKPTILKQRSRGGRSRKPQAIAMVG